MNEGRASFLTAIKLKRAGFPQPQPAFGQMWYNPNGVPFLVLSADDETVEYIMKSYNVVKRQPKAQFPGSAAYAPTESDILEQLPEYSLSYEMGRTRSGSEWLVYDTGAPKDRRVFYRHETSPTEACASAWLEDQNQER